MTTQMNQHDYYYGSEANQYTFYRLPKALFEDAQYKTLSGDAKILYGLMLDRMGLSIKNGWLDDRNRVYIYFTLEDVQEYMNCKQDKGVKLLAELDSDKGVGLIERVKQGQGKPTKIYVKKFIQGPEPQASEKPKSGLPNSPESALPEKPKPAPRKNRSQDFGKTETNNNDFNKTDFNDTEYQSHQSIQPLRPEPDAQGGSEKPERDGLMDRVAEIEAYREIIKDNIEYDLQCEQYGKEDIDEIVELMLEAVCTRRKMVRVGKEEWPAGIVRSRLLKLNQFHIDYVFETMKDNTSKVYNIKNYLLTTLYNAPNTMSNYYRARVNNDFYGNKE